MGSELKTLKPFADKVAMLSHPKAQACMASRQWLSPELCSEIFQTDPHAKVAWDPIYEKHKKEISELQELLDCLSKVPELNAPEKPQADSGASASPMSP